MNAQMRLVIMLASVAVSGSLLFAAEPAPPPKEEPRPAQQAPAANASQQAAKDERDAKDEEAGQPPSGDDKARSPQRFTPSEQVRADFDVSFPIDI